MKNFCCFLMMLFIFIEFSFARETMRDSRDGHAYKIVMIGGQTWFAENLAIKTKNSICYKNNAAHCLKNGRLYQLDDAMNACPKGWHLPSKNEYEKLLDAVAERVQIEDCGDPDCQGEQDRIVTNWKNAGKALAKQGFAINDYGMRNVYTVCGGGMDVDEFNDGTVFWSLGDAEANASNYILFEKGNASINDDFEGCGCYKSCPENYYPVRCVKD